jgi:hypothetical protein
LVQFLLLLIFRFHGSGLFQEGKLVVGKLLMLMEIVEGNEESYNRLT